MSDLVSLGEGHYVNFDLVARVHEINAEHDLLYGEWAGFDDDLLLGDVVIWFSFAGKGCVVKYTGSLALALRQYLDQWRTRT